MDLRFKGGWTSSGKSAHSVYTRSLFSSELVPKPLLMFALLLETNKSLFLNFQDVGIFRAELMLTFVSTTGISLIIAVSTHPPKNKGEVTVSRDAITEDHHLS